MVRSGHSWAPLDPAHPQQRRSLGDPIRPPKLLLKPTSTIAHPAFAAMNLAADWLPARAPSITSLQRSTHSLQI
jgi:hypothetical protein